MFLSYFVVMHLWYTQKYLKNLVFIRNNIHVFQILSTTEILKNHFFLFKINNMFSILFDPSLSELWCYSTLLFYLPQSKRTFLGFLHLLFFLFFISLVGGGSYKLWLRVSAIHYTHVFNFLLLLLSALTFILCYSSRQFKKRLPRKQIVLWKKVFGISNHAKLYAILKFIAVFIIHKYIFFYMK